MHPFRAALAFARITLYRLMMLARRFGHGVSAGVHMPLLACFRELNKAGSSLVGVRKVFDRINVFSVKNC